MELSEERLWNEYQQIQKYGHSALLIYMDYTNVINHKTKWIMLEISNSYKAKGLDDKKMKDINDELLDKYNQFWSFVGPHMIEFYERLYKVLEVKDSFKEEVNSEKQVEKLVYSEKEILNLEEEVTELEIQVLNEQCFLDLLKQIKESLDQQLKLKDQLDEELKVIERDSKQFKINEKIIQKSQESLKNLEVGSLLRKRLTVEQVREMNTRKMELIKWLEKGDLNESMPYEIKTEEPKEPAVTLSEEEHVGNK